MIGDEVGVWLPIALLVLSAICFRSASKAELVGVVGKVLGFMLLVGMTSGVIFGGVEEFVGLKLSVDELKPVAF